MQTTSMHASWWPWRGVSRGGPVCAWWSS